MTNELNPCPFCNEIDNSDIELYGRSRLRVYSSWVVDGHIYFVKCEACGARGPYFFTEKEAIAAWNTRHEPDDVNRMRNLLEDVVNALDLSEIAIETHGPLGTEPAELVKLVLQQKDREIALLHHESDELPEWLIARINELREFILKSKYSDWKYSLYSDSEQFHILQCEIDKYLGYVLSFRKPEEKE